MRGTSAINLPKLNLLSDQYPVLKTFTMGRNNPGIDVKFAEDYIQSAFERIQGVAKGNVFGGQEQEFRVEIDPDASCGIRNHDRRIKNGSINAKS